MNTEDQGQDGEQGSQKMQKLSRSYFQRNRSCDSERKLQEGRSVGGQRASPGDWGGGRTESGGRGAWDEPSTLSQTGPVAFLKLHKRYTAFAENLENKGKQYK